MPQSQQRIEAFFLASKQSEIASLKQLMASCTQVTQVSNLIHELQRERGLSNVYLASGGTRLCDQRLAQIDSARRAEADFRIGLEQLDLETGPLAGRARLFNNLAHVLHGLDALPGLRQAVDQLELKPEQSTQAYSRLMESLLGVIFEAADISDDPEITRQLVAMFNLMQGKEYAGQERAWAVSGIAAGEFSAELLERIGNLIEAQEHCFSTFKEFALQPQLDAWQMLLEQPETDEFMRLRQVIARLTPGAGVPPDISEVWYDLATRRIDAMQVLERELADLLLTLSDERVQQANSDLKNQRASLASLQSSLESSADSQAPSPLTLLLGYTSALPPAGAAGGADWVRSLYGLVQQQAESLKQMSSELGAARQALSERKLLERAKGLLMQYHGLDEEQAFRTLQQSAMSQKKRLIEVAEKVIADVERIKGGHKTARRAPN
ncbi:nitrate regulatory protein [Marinobacterium lutimaris]|uniref:ANTAR domain-containing protein n=1 Tax=Marinobacterium lutimaris TaxID=568106 RepID=A0A1H6D9J2_9GAMM|nr:nitrate regulatory protein [Marinobacterium lutimaris]SEG81176.1 ANTAR domain-containing protein [Marinobacterium lutimaris]